MHTVEEYDRAWRYFEGLYYRYLSRDRWVRNRIKNVVELVEVGQESLIRLRILDVGCGIGTFVEEFRARGSFVVGVDFSKVALGYARLLMGVGRLVRASCERLPFRDCVFDVVLAADFVEHLRDAELLFFFEEARRVLRLRGRLIIYAPSPDHLFERFQQRGFLLKKDESHVGLRKLQDYRYWLGRRGFVVERAYCRPTHIPVWRFVERGLMWLPRIGKLFQRRCCISAQRL